MSSYLTQINAFLSETRQLLLPELNAMIADLDPDAEPIESATVAHATLGYLKSAELKGDAAVFADAFRRATELKEGQEWLFIDDTPTAAVKPAAAAKPAAEPAAPKARKSDQAKAIFDALEDKSKANVMRVFQEKLNTTAAGAQTYFYACGGERVGRRGRHSADSGVEVVRIPKRETPTKLELARKLYANNPKATRTDIIALFQSDLKMSKSGATTYYYTVSKIAAAEKDAAAAATAAPQAAVAAIAASEEAEVALTADVAEDAPLVATDVVEEAPLDPVTAAFAAAVVADDTAAPAGSEEAAEAV